MTRTWRLDDGRQTLVFASEDDRLPEVVYWGAPLPTSEDLGAVAAAARNDLSGGMLDRLAPLSICPDGWDSFPGQPALLLAAADGAPLRPRLRFSEATAGGGEIGFVALDAALGLAYRARIATGPEGLIELSAVLESERPLRLLWLAAPLLPAPQLADDFVDVAGRWLGEFQLNRIPWTPGARLREARTGRSGHEHFPGALFPVRGATNVAGEVYVLHYGWSGGHRMVAEELADGRRQIQFGHAVGSETAPATRFETAILYATYSAEGLNGAAVRFQRHLRETAGVLARSCAGATGSL